MSVLEIACVKGKPKLIGKGLFRYVFKKGRLVLKVESNKHSLEELRRRAAQTDSRIRGLREELPFLPEYYGTVIGSVNRGKKLYPVLISFHEYIKPLNYFSVSKMRGVIKLIGEAAEKGYVLDVKMPNFGIKGNKIYYLDEFGIGRNPLPPDLTESIVRNFKSLWRQRKG